MEGWDLVAVGDRKTPAPYELRRGLYLSPEDQEKYDPELSAAIGWNCMQRRNFGLLFAHDMGADVVAVVDDDNIPYDGWGQHLLLGREIHADRYETPLPAFDPVGATNHGHLWHRGFPLQLLARRDYSEKTKTAIVPDIQADLLNGDPDIDAVCLMEHAPDCDFDRRAFPLFGNRMSPFNSQNTFLTGAMLKDYFLFPGIGRMDDIWASYYVQAKGYRVVYGAPSVFQSRNEHDLTRDMQAEWLGYQHNLNIVRDLATDPEKILAYLPDQARRAFELYRRHFQ
ncbi:MAG: hypothetical protein E6Q40_06065 [Cupriavidus sp.]|nr:MAG: hypothetical protein E6Q40_06065 [Cupriavidus sp.]